MIHRILSHARSTFVAATACAALTCASVAFAQTEFPSKPITIVTPFSAGSGPDAVARVLGEGLAKKWGQRVVVDNRPGGGGFVAIEVARRAAPDGYTLLLLDSEHLSALPFLYKQRGFKTLDTFDPVASLFRTPFLVAVATNSPWKSVGDLVSARAKKSSVTYGSWGIGSPGHLGGAMLAGLTDTQMEHIAFRDVSQLFISVSSGDVTWSLGTLPSSRPAFQSGKLRYLAVAGPRRVAQMPNVPTVAEAGGPAGMDISSFAVLVAPKGMPEPLAAKLHADINKAMEDSELRARLDSFAFEPVAWSRSEILTNARSKATVYQQLIERNNITLD